MSNPTITTRTKHPVSSPVAISVGVVKSSIPCASNTSAYRRPIGPYDTTRVKRQPSSARRPNEACASFTWVENRHLGREEELELGGGLSPEGAAASSPGRQPWVPGSNYGLALKGNAVNDFSASVTVFSGR